MKLWTRLLGAAAVASGLGSAGLGALPAHADSGSSGLVQFQRFYNPSTQMYWVTTNPAEVSSDYTFQSTLGDLYTTPQPNTTALDDCVYPGTQDQFVQEEPYPTPGSNGLAQTAPAPAVPFGAGTPTCTLAGYVDIGPTDAAGLPTVQLYRCYRIALTQFQPSADGQSWVETTTSADEWASTDPGCEGQGPQNASLGYAVVDGAQAPGTGGSGGTAGSTLPADLPTSGTVTTPSGQPCQITLAQAQEEYALFQLLNQHRAAAGVPPLQLNETLSNASREFACDVALNLGALPPNHVGSDGSTFDQRISATGVSYAWDGENAGWASAGYPSLDAAVQAIDDNMMNNDAAANWGHRDNILNPSYTQVGIGVIQDSSGQVWLTEDFIG